MFYLRYKKKCYLVKFKENTDSVNLLQIKSKPDLQIIVLCLTLCLEQF